MRSLRILVLTVLTAVYISAAPLDDPKLQVHHNANVFASPTTQSAIKAHVVPGDELTQIQPTRTLGFYKVRTADGVEGWIYQTLVHVIEEDEDTTPTFAAASAVLPTWDKPSPVGSILHGPPGKTCAADGEPGGDTETNARKNRKDVPSSYHDVSFKALATLPYPDTGPDRTKWKPPAKKAQWDAEIAEHEGVAVSVIGYIVAVKKQYGGTGEGTNCHFSTPDLVDVHVALVENAGDGEKTSIVVEPTPRFYAAHPKWIWSKLNDLDDSHDPVRVSGWVLFDPVHKGHLGKFRATLWEIHPITKIEVFKNGQWTIW